MIEKIPSSWNPLIVQRAGKLNSLKSQGINPFHPTKFVRSHTILDLRRTCETMSDEAVMPVNIRIAGRLMSLRQMGKIAFVHIEDESGKLQLYFAKDIIGEEKFETFKKFLEIGDFLGLEGDMFRTRTNELTLKIKDYTILSKALRPLPEKWHGLKDSEIRQRQRYLDLAANPEVRETFRKRSQIVWLMRQFLHDHGFMEVETPILQEIHGGASARPFVTHHNALDMDLYLRIATELHLKRLIVGGYEKVFEIGRVFRNEGIDIRHNPEFTSMELYWAYANYEDVMKITEEVVSFIVKSIFDKYHVDYQGNILDFTPPWNRITMEDAIAQIGGIEVSGVSAEQLLFAARGKGIEVEESMSRGWLINSLFEGLVEKQLTQPTFIYRYPVETTPLAKRSPDDPNFVERFEAFIAGMELANAFSELNDPIDQRERFEEQVRMKEAGDEEAQPYDEDFVQALEVGMPPTGGLGIGIDRLAMVLTDAPSIRDVILFPTMRKRG
jgi:lysyl-tRNA synthetase class 2